MSCFVFSVVESLLRNSFVIDHLDVGYAKLGQWGLTLKTYMYLPGNR